MKKWVLIGALVWLACAGHAQNLTIRALDTNTHGDITGIHVFCNGMFVGTTPYTVPPVFFNPGSYQISDPGGLYGPWFPTFIYITSVESDREIIFWGTRNQYPLTIRTQIRVSATEYQEISGLEIWVNGIPTGFNTPHTFLESPPPGDYSVIYPGEWVDSFPNSYYVDTISYPGELMFTVSAPATTLPVADVGVAVNQNNAELTWQPYNFFIAGQPVPPDYYFVYSSVNADGPFSFLDMSPTPSFTHYNAVPASPKMFYRVTAVLNVRRDLPSREFESILREKLKPGMSETEAMAVFKSTQWK